MPRLISNSEEMQKPDILTFQYIQAYAAKFVNVGMVDFGKKPDFGRGHRIVVWEEKFEFEDAGYVGYQLSESYCPYHLLTFIG